MVLDFEQEQPWLGLGFGLVMDGGATVELNPLDDLIETGIRIDVLPYATRMALDYGTSIPTLPFMTRKTPTVD